MGHEKLKDKLCDLYDGELKGKIRQEVQAHKEGCGECGQIYSQWREISKALLRPPWVRTSETFVQKVLEGLGEPQATTIP